MNESGAAPCHCTSPGSACTVSPARISVMAPPLRCTRPVPAVTCSTCPNGWACQALREPGVKCTFLTRIPNGGWPAAISSSQTSPVKQPAGPAWVTG